ncbi:hypothetical protein B0H11DRAFT_1029849 [Mycena galericulata]|nr:hypothetical protein B0H11DRAFT_1029849 [Mycena galericulata]
MSSLFTISSAAGPSQTTLQALSEYCSSSDSPEPSFLPSESSYSLVSDTTPISPPTQSAPELPDIIAQSSRFQATDVREKMLKALKGSARSGFTRSAQMGRSVRGERSATLASTRAIYEGLPPSPSDFFFDDTALLETSTPVRFGHGLGLLVPSSSTNELRPLSLFASLRASSSHGVETHVQPDVLSSRLSLLSPPLTPRSLATPPRAVTASAPSSRYVGLGYGLPSDLQSGSGGRFSLSGFTLSSGARSISQLLGSIVASPSLSYSHSLLHGTMPSLTRLASDTTNMGAIARLRAGAASFVHARLRRFSGALGTEPATDVLNDSSRGLKRVLVLVGRIVGRK